MVVWDEVELCLKRQEEFKIRGKLKFAAAGLGISILTGSVHLVDISKISGNILKQSPTVSA